MTKVRNTVASVVAFSVRRSPFVVLAYVILLVASVLAAVKYLEINTDSRGMLNQELPFQQRTAALADAFPHLFDDVFVVLDSSVPDASDAVAASLVETLQGKPGVASAFSETASPFFQAHGLLYEDTEAFQEALRNLDSSADLLAGLRETPTAQALFSSLAAINGFQASADLETAQTLDRIYAQMATVLTAKAAGEPAALSWQNLMGGEAAQKPVTRVVQIRPQLDYTELQPAETTLRSISAAIDALPSSVGSATAELVTVRVTGEPVLMFEELEAVADGIGLSLGASMVVVVILLVICYGSIRRMLVTLAAIIVALGLALGFASVALGPLNLVSIAFVVPLVGLGLDFAIHVTTRAAELERKGATQRQAFIESGRGIALALGLSAFTTAAAFLSFVGTDFVGMGQVGVIGAVGVLIAFVISVTLVPALATIGIHRSEELPEPIEPAASNPSAYGLRQKRVRQAATALLAVLAVGSVAVAPQVRFDTDPTNLRDPESPSMVALAALMGNPDTAPYRVSLLGTESEVDAFAQKVDGTAQVHTVATLARLVPTDQAAKLSHFERSHPNIMARLLGPAQLPTATDDAMAVLASELSEGSTGEGGDRLYEVLTGSAATMDDADLDQALVGFLPQLFNRLRAQANMAEFSADDLPSAVKDQFLSASGLYRVEVGPANNIRTPENRTNFVEQLVAVDENITGAPFEISRAGAVVSGAMIQATSVAAFVVTIMCLIVLRSVRETLAVLLPLAMGGLLVVGTMVLLDLPFNYANVIVLPLIIGLGVDSSIHLAVRKREEESGSVYATSTPRAVLFSGLTTAVAFVSLALSSHRGTASMGELLGLSIAIVLVTTIVATPTLLEMLKPPRTHG
ncbi:MAG: MMPL family transporter [Pseudomonadota bacterium]